MALRSVKSIFYLALQKRIADITVSDAKVFRYINHDLGFLDEDIPPLSYPAALIDMNGFDYSDMLENAQLATGRVGLKVVFAPYSDTSNLTPDKWKDKGLQYYEIEEALHKALQGWKPEYIIEVTPADPGSPGDPDAEPPVEAVPPTPAVTEDLLNYFQQLTRISDGTDPRRKDLRVRKVAYNVAFEDYGTMPEIEYVDSPDAEIDITDSIIVDDPEVEGEDL